MILHPQPDHIIAFGDFIMSWAVDGYPASNDHVVTTLDEGPAWNVAASRGPDSAGCTSLTGWR